MRASRRASDRPAQNYLVSVPRTFRSATVFGSTKCGESAAGGPPSEPADRPVRTGRVTARSRRRAGPRAEHRPSPQRHRRSRRTAPARRPSAPASEASTASVGKGLRRRGPPSTRVPVGVAAAAGERRGRSPEGSAVNGPTTAVKRGETSDGEFAALGTPPSRVLVHRPQSDSAPRISPFPFGSISSVRSAARTPALTATTAPTALTAPTAPTAPTTPTAPTRAAAFARRERVPLRHPVPSAET